MSKFVQRVFLAEVVLGDNHCQKNVNNCNGGCSQNAKGVHTLGMFYVFDFCGGHILNIRCCLFNLLGAHILNIILFDCLGPLSWIVFVC